MEELAVTDCTQCGELQIDGNLDRCLICDRCERACYSCLEKHKATHSQSELEAFKREMLDEQPLTAREQINLELKQQIRAQAETLCKLIDDQESLVKKYEKQCRVLAQEIDGRRQEWKC